MRELLAQRLGAALKLAVRVIPLDPREDRADRGEITDREDVRSRRGILREVQELLALQVVRDLPYRPGTVQRADQAGQPLLPVEDVVHRGTLVLGHGVQARDLMAAGQLGRGTPHEKAADGIVPAHRVEQVQDLLWGPDERSLELG